LTSATANGADADVGYGANTPPAPDDDVHEIAHSIVVVVNKWYPSYGDVDDAFRYVSNTGQARLDYTQRRVRRRYTRPGPGRSGHPNQT